MKRAGSNTNDTNAQSSMQEGLIEIAPLVQRHSAIFSRFAVKDQVRDRNGAADDGGAIEQFLRQIPRALSHAVCRLDIRALESALEGLPRLLERRLLRRLLEGAILMEESDCHVRRLWELFDRSRDGQRLANKE